MENPASIGPQVGPQSAGSGSGHLQCSNSQKKLGKTTVPAWPRESPRRYRERLKIQVPVLVWPVYPAYKGLEEVTRTIDFSRNGVCFVGLLDHYKVGLMLFVTSPFYGTPGRKLLGQVVRIERLPNGAHSVAVEFLSE